jgi:hypothetical protein
MLLRHAARFALSRAREIIGSKMPIKTAMIPTTTSSSTNENPRFRITLLDP